MSDQPQKRAPLTGGRRALAVGIGIALASVIVAPLVLSSQDLVRWATADSGLGMSTALGWVVILALDLAAATCVGMVTLAAWRGESALSFHILTWGFAGASAYANHRHGIELRDAGKAKDAWWFFPAMSIAGPLLLEVVLSKVKKWVRVDEGKQMAARPRFGARWVPGVAFRETARAWAASRRENIESPANAIAYVRECDALKPMDERGAVDFARAALQSGERAADGYAVRQWLIARHVTITEWHLEVDGPAATDGDRAALPETSGPAGNGTHTARVPTLPEAPDWRAANTQPMTALAPNYTLTVPHPATLPVRETSADHNGVSGTDAAPANPPAGPPATPPASVPARSGTDRHTAPPAAPGSVAAPDVPAAETAPAAPMPSGTGTAADTESEAAAGPAAMPPHPAGVLRAKGATVPTAAERSELGVNGLRTAAQREWRKLADAGHVVSGETLGKAFGRSERWGRDQIAQVRESNQDVIHLVKRSESS